MSHSSGMVRFSDGEIWHFEYNGTCDVCISHIYKTKEEVVENWRKSVWVDCKCGGEEDVEVYSDYGGGFMIEGGKSCRKCCSLTATDEICDFLEDWVEEMKNHEN